MTSEDPNSFAPAPLPRSDRRSLSIALGLVAAGLAVLVLVLAGAWRTVAPAAVTRLPAPPPIVLGATPIADTAAGLAAPPGVIESAPSGTAQAGDGARFARPGPTHVSARWEAGFYAVYAAAQHTFAVNWLLLASIHKQETAFSTAPRTYRGLNFARCCGGPMQFNVRNGPVTTWRLVMGAYRFGSRPAAYNHATAHHPSIYDDFDSIMAAAWLLSSDGASMTLGAGAWQAAYDYYGHDTTGVTYADQVLARAIGWSQTGFCVNCALPTSLVAAVHAAYGAPALAQLEAAAAASAAADAAHAARARTAAARRARPGPPRAAAPRAVAASASARGRSR